MMNNNELKKYIKNKKIFTAKVIFTQFFILILFITLWEILAQYNVINTFLCSSPSKIIKTLLTLWKNNDLFIHIWITTKEIIISFILGSFLGIFMAAMLWWNDFLAKVLDPYLTILNSLPKVSLGPLIIIWAGANQKSIIIMALLISVISTIISVYNGFKNTNKNYIKLLESFNANKFQIFFNIILPANKNTIISSLKINLSLTFVGIIMGELLVSKQGIGYLINYGSQVFNTSLVMTGIILLGILTTILYFSILFFEKKNQK